MGAMHVPPGRSKQAPLGVGDGARRMLTFKRAWVR
jgi:hypothetical protein